MRKLIYRINRWLPFGGLPIAQVLLGRNTCTLYKNGWVLISDGRSTDALPINFTSQALVDAFAAELA
ncbi:hypothetical protein ABE484_10940 [Pseudomonas pudica]|uniref:hypothetical protein n=1 Tax=Pseudomonas TaxID=286 RepID=UPI00235BEBD7|nr:hypothetical protein [Pseudomonas putida]GLO38885.1 hypothetical protein PPUN15366_05290 [Pseudomonas putida]HDS0974451.1 hypothetical protein [Pseudomonas putida]